MAKKDLSRSDVALSANGLPYSASFFPIENQRNLIFCAILGARFFLPEDECLERVQ